MMKLGEFNSAGTAACAVPTRRQFLVGVGAGSITLALPVRAEDLRLGAPVTAATEELLALSGDEPPRELAANAEVLVVSGYEPSGDRATVRVDRPGKRVVLVLSSYERMLWVVKATPTTRLVAILVGAEAADSVGGVICEAQVQAFQLKLPSAYEANNIRFRALTDRLYGLFGIDRIDAFRGAYRIPRSVNLDKLDALSQELTVVGVAPTRPKANFTFDLLAVDFTKVRWSLTGPAAEQAVIYADQGGVVRAPFGDTVYRIGKNGLDILDRATGTSSLATLPPNFPSFSWPTDVAYDSRLKIVSVVTLGGEGYLYRYDVAAQRWLDFRSLNNVDISALAYDDTAGRYVGWTTDGALLLMPSSGSTLSVRPLAAILPAFGAAYDRGNGPPPRLTLIPHGNLLALVQISGGHVERIWSYDIRAGVGQLTYVAGARH